MFDTMNVAKIIKQKRMEKNLTQMQLADAPGISYQAVSNWERGNSMPDISKLGELSTVLGCSVEELLGNNDKAKVVEDMIKGEEPKEMDMEELVDVAPILPPRSKRRGPFRPCGSCTVFIGRNVRTVCGKCQ